MTPAEAQIAIDRISKRYPRMIVLNHWATFHIMGNFIDIQIIYAINTGYGYSRGPFEGYYSIYWNPTTNKAEGMFYDAYTSQNPF
jgi:hypothetical protein